MKKTIVLLLAFFLISCNQESITEKEPAVPANYDESQTAALEEENLENNRLHAITLLDKKSLLYKNLRNSESLAKLYKGQFGEVDYDHIFQLQFETPGHQVISMPLGSLDKDPSRLRLLSGMYIDEVNDFLYWIVEVIPEGGVKGKDLTELLYGGAYNVYNLVGDPLVKSSFREGELSNFEFFKNTSLVIPDSQSKLTVCEDFWRFVFCTNDCMEDAWNQLSWLERVLCGAAVGGCIYSTGTVFPACLVAAGCVTPIIFSCNLNCYRKFCQN